VISSLKEIFLPKIKARSALPFADADLREYIKSNRNSLQIIDDWIDAVAFKRSWFNYGVPDFIQNDINKQINDSPTYSDVMLLIAKKYFTNLNYLEIGISVGKNFFQLLNASENATFCAFDIEEINPVIERKLKFQHKVEWDTLSESIKKSRSSIKTYTFNNTEVKYLCADVWDGNSWAKLKGNKFNLVFSDALHSAEAILFEFENLVKYDLLDERFVIVWDDLEGKMKKAFFKILQKYNKVYQLQEIYLIHINGWIGEHEKPHSVGIISNFSF
jgi:hypothetical protein